MKYFLKVNTGTTVTQEDSPIILSGNRTIWGCKMLLLDPKYNKNFAMKWVSFLQTIMSGFDFDWTIRLSS